MASQVAQPFLTIVGETASGKSALAMKLAQEFNGEIICADSRTIYTGMDIGTAKPSVADRSLIAHHILDIITPDQRFSAADFKAQAEAAIADILARDKLPIMVGGTGLYVDAVLYNFAFRAPANPDERQKLEKLSVDELQQALAAKGIPLPNNPQNPRHLIRALETGGQQSERQTLRGNTLVLGLKIDRELLEKRIEKRIDDMVTTGLLEEIESLAKKYGWDAPGLQAPGYRAFRPYFAGDIDLVTAKKQFAQNDKQLAKRQRTWFKRNADIQWISTVEQANERVKNLLQDNA
ncbi:tRNA (adenosine(37)-N6)-dimethylallyltransferase MiaA [Candidatus Saccharibacteria bacterium]|nr:tRNA (adenosine(37)-N6)-dimethylallyltransferase MiaA [Candidatus Saccharibacteria bacterium]